MFRILAWLAAALIVVLLVYVFGGWFIGPIWAQTTPAGDTAVVVPYGSWLQQVLAVVRDVAITAVPLALAWAARSLPGYAKFWFQTKIAEQWLTRAIDGAHNSVAGAVKGKALTVDVGNAVLAHAVQDMIDNAPTWIVNFLGGIDGLKRAILRRLDLEAKAVAVIDSYTGAVMIEAMPKPAK